MRIHGRGSGKDRLDLPWLVFILSSALLLAFVSVLAGYAARATIGEAVESVESLLNAFENPLTTENVPHSTPIGFHLVREVADPGYLLLSGYLIDEERIGIRLIDLSDGTVVHSWYPDPMEIRRRSSYAAFSDPDRFQPENPVLLADGGLAFIDNQGPLVRIDGCSRLVWVTDGQFHHSLERDLQGNFVAPIVIRPHFRDELLPDPFRDDGYAVVSPDGEILETRSVTRILLDAGLVGILHTTYPREFDFAHLNDVETARQDAGVWLRGDMVLSLRKLNLVFIYRPSTNEVVWWQIGPWLKQHDPDFQPDGSITVFSNDVMGEEEEMKFIRGHSSVYSVDPVSGTTELRFADVMAAEAIGTITQGLVELLPNGDMFVEETDVGRLMRIREDGVVWSYYNRDEDRAGALFWSRFLTEAEVTAVDLPAECSSR